MTGKGDFSNDTANIIFNRDIIINESEVIEDCSTSVGILDDKTIRENHPWYNEEVEKRLEEQRKKEQEEIDQYRGTFPRQNGGNLDDEE